MMAGVCVCQCRVDTRKDETLGRRVNKNEFLLKLKASLAWAWHTTIRSTIPSRSAVENGDTHPHQKSGSIYNSTLRWEGRIKRRGDITLAPYII
jgi:hypothetical protein